MIEFIADNEKLKSGCYAEVSISTVNRLGCQDILDSQVRSYCLAKVAAVRAELPICSNIDDESCTEND